MNKKHRKKLEIKARFETLIKNKTINPNKWPIRVRCNQELHKISLNMTNGRLRLENHSKEDLKIDRVMHIMGGIKICRCYCVLAYVKSANKFRKSFTITPTCEISRKMPRRLRLYMETCNSISNRRLSNAFMGKVLRLELIEEIVKKRFFKALEKAYKSRYHSYLKLFSPIPISKFNIEMRYPSNSLFSKIISIYYPEYVCFHLLMKCYSPIVTPKIILRDWLFKIDKMGLSVLDGYMLCSISDRTETVIRGQIICMEDTGPVLKEAVFELKKQKHTSWKFWQKPVITKVWKLICSERSYY